MTLRRSPLRRRLRLVLPLALLLAAAGPPGCDARARAIRARLSADERALFDRGRQLAAPCWACHDVLGRQDKVGPHLSGLWGRRAGASRFPAYSDALRSTGIVWDERTLDAFLADPAGYVPGTSMIFPGIGDARDRAALLFYLEQVTQPNAVQASR